MALERVLNALVEKIRRDYPNDISLLHVHGSFAYGDTHELSDLDLYFVAKTPRGENLACTFILGGVGCGFCSIPWQRLFEKLLAGQGLPVRRFECFSEFQAFLDAL